VRYRTEPVPPRKGWYGGDPEAGMARGLRIGGEMHLAGAQLHASSESLKFRVIPGFEPDFFAIDGDVPAALTTARSALLEHDAVWHQPNICMEFQMMVAELLYFRECYRYIQFSEPEPRVLERIDALAPETIYTSQTRNRRTVEQYVRAEIAGRETWFEFADHELLMLAWPLAEPAGPRPPERAALVAGVAEDRLADRMLLPLRAQNDPGERFVTFARARQGAYSDALAETKRVSARVADLLYDIPQEPTTRYFEMQRIIRAQRAASELREYLVREFNRQVLTRWAATNRWGRLELTIAAPLLSAADWQDVWLSFRDRSLSYDDVCDLLASDRDATKSTRLGLA
jgi:hypothetical protein